MATVRIISASDERAVSRIASAPERRDARVAAAVERIVADVRRRGDAAVKAYARRFDGFEGPMEVSRDEIDAAVRQTPPAVRRALRTAAVNIRKVARRQVPKPVVTTVVPGVVIEQAVSPLRRVGCYVPAGRYPLPSSLLMTAIPARAAGVAEVVAVCPRPAPVVLAAAREAGVDRIFRIGGAQAIAALAYGTATVPRVDKIVGPGSRYVAEAKAIVSRDCAIDFHAGPSEIVIVSDLTSARWVAADMLAQAEHDVDARAIFVTTKPALARAVQRAIDARLPAAGPARTALAARGAIIVARSRAEAIDVTDRLSPEHLCATTRKSQRPFVPARRLSAPGARRPPATM